MPGAMKIRPPVAACAGILAVGMATTLLARVGSAALDRVQIPVPGSQVELPQFPGEEFVELWADRASGVGLGCGPESTAWTYTVPIELVSRRGGETIRRRGAGAVIV